MIANKIDLRAQRIKQNIVFDLENRQKKFIQSRSRAFTLISILYGKYLLIEKSETISGKHENC